MKMYSSDWKTKSLFPYWELPKNKELIPLSRNLRKSGILSEVIFWKTFNKTVNCKWDLDRQIIIGNYIVDFLIPELGFIIEIDGISHDYKIDYDEEREKYLRNLNLEVIHLKDIDIKHNLDNVSKFISKKIEDREEFLINLKMNKAR